MQEKLSRHVSDGESIEKIVKNELQKAPVNGGIVIDSALVEAMSKGDEEAFKKIYLHSIDKLVEFLKILLQSREDAEEVAQDVFTYLWEHKESMDPRKNFKGYLYTMAKNAAYMYIRRRRLDEKYYNHRLHATPDFVEAPDEAVISNELSLLIEVCISNMPEQRRKVYELSRIEGKSDAEVAKAMNLSITTVRTHLRLAMSDLRKLAALSIILFLS